MLNGAEAAGRSRPRRTASSHSTPVRRPPSELHGGVVCLDGRREDAAAAGVVDAEIGLHDRGRTADLVARERAAPGGGQPFVQRVLDLVALILVGRSQVAGKAVEHLTPQAMRGEQVGCCGDVHVKLLRGGNLYAGMPAYQWAPEVSHAGPAVASTPTADTRRQSWRST